jgi:hypothetical protein
MEGPDKGGDMQRLPLVLSATALVVALLGATPLGHAAGAAAAKVVPFAKRSGYAANAGAVDGISAARTPRAGLLVPLGPDGKLPASVAPAGPQGLPGPVGPPGPQGAQGDPGLSGVQFVYGLSPGNGADVAEASATCPPGKQLIGGGMIPNQHLPDGYVAVTESGPVEHANAWVAKAMEVKPYAGVWTIEAWAICANVAS